MGRKRQDVNFEGKTKKERVALTRKRGRFVFVLPKTQRKTLSELGKEYLAVIDPETKMSQAELCVIALVDKAKEGNIQAFTVLRDTIGEMPTQKKEITGVNGEPLSIAVKFVQNVQSKIDATQPLSIEQHQQTTIDVTATNKDSEVKVNGTKPSDLIVDELFEEVKEEVEK